MSNTENYYSQNYTPDAWAMNQMLMSSGGFMPPMNSKGEPEPYDLDTQGKYRNALQDVVGSMDDPAWALISGLGATDPRAFDPIVTRKPFERTALAQLKITAAGTGIEAALAGMILPVEEGGQGMSALQAAGALRAAIEHPEEIKDGSFTPQQANEFLAQLPPIEKKNQYGQSTNEMTGDVGALSKIAQGLAQPFVAEQAALQQPGIEFDGQGQAFTTSEAPSPMQEFLQKSGLPDPRQGYDSNYLMQTDPSMPGIMDRLSSAKTRLNDAQQAFQKYLGAKATRDRYLSQDERNSAAYKDQMKAYATQLAAQGRVTAAQNAPGGVGVSGSRRSTPEEAARAMANAALFGGSGGTTSAIGTGRDMSGWSRTINPDGSISYAAPGQDTGTTSAIGTGRDMSSWVRTVNPDGSISYAAPSGDTQSAIGSGRDMSGWARTINPDDSINYAAPGQPSRTLSAVGTPMGEEMMRADEWARTVNPDGSIKYTSPYVNEETFSKFFGPEPTQGPRASSPRTSEQQAIARNTTGFFGGDPTLGQPVPPGANDPTRGMNPDQAATMRALMQQLLGPAVTAGGSRRITPQEAAAAAANAGTMDRRVGSRSADPNSLEDLRLMSGSVLGVGPNGDLPLGAIGSALGSAWDKINGGGVGKALDAAMVMNPTTAPLGLMRGIFGHGTGGTGLGEAAQAFSGGSPLNAALMLNPTTAMAGLMRRIFSDTPGGGGGGGSKPDAAPGGLQPPKAPIISQYTNPPQENLLQKQQRLATNILRKAAGLPPLPDPADRLKVGNIADVNKQLFAARRAYGNSVSDMMQKDLQMKMLARRGRTPLGDALQARMAPMYASGALGQYQSG